MTFWRRSKLFIYYCLPSLMAVGVVLFFNFLRVRTEVAPIVIANACAAVKNKPEPNPSVSPTPTPAKLSQIVEAVRVKGWANCDEASQREMRNSFLTVWWSNGLSIFALSLLPFGIMGLGLALRYQRKRPVAADDRARYTSYRKIANRDFIMKLLVGFIIAWGWLYLFNPTGQAASAINSWLANTNVIAGNTAPIFFNLEDSKIKHALIGLLGWYLYLLGYLIYRFYKSDVFSTRIYHVFFKKFLFVIGVALIFSSVSAGSTESLILVFLIGMFPLSAVTLLTEFGNKRLSMGEDQTSLSILPGISTWQVLRLDEEGIDSVSALATATPEELSSISSKVIEPERLRDWIDQARLITVLGPKRWSDLNGVCERATVFLQKEHDATFIDSLKAKNVTNPDEIATTLRNTFSKS